MHFAMCFGYLAHEPIETEFHLAILTLHFKLFSHHPIVTWGGGT